LISLPLFDLPTRSSSGFLIRYVVPRSYPPHLVGMLDRKRAFQTLALGDLIIGAGHGSPTEFCGHDNEVLMDIRNMPDVKGKVVILISCETAQELGPALIAAGAKGYIGFRQDLVWVVDADKSATPWRDEIAEPVMMPLVTCINEVMDGKKVGEAFDTMQRNFSGNIAKEADELVRSCLIFNGKNAVFLGDPNAMVKKRPPLFIGFKLIPPPPIVSPVRKPTD